MRKQATFLLTGSAVAALLLASCSCRWGMSWGGYSFDRQGETAERRLTGEIAPDTRSITIENVFGSVSVTAADEGTDGAEGVGWEWELTCWGTTQADADRLVQEITLVTEQQEGAATWRLVLPKPPVPELRGIESNLTLTAPPAVAVMLSNEHGPTTIAGTAGGTTVRSRHGSVAVEDLAGTIAVSSVHGSLRAERIPGGRLENEHGSVYASVVEGDLTVRNGHGPVRVDTVTGSAAVRTSHATLTVQGVAKGATLVNTHGSIYAAGVAERLEVRTDYGSIEAETDGVECIGANEHGSITVTVTNPAATVVHLETEHGDLDLTLPSGSQPRITAGTSHGRIDSHWPVHVAENRRHRQAIEAGPQDATLQVKLFNSHGDITVR